MLKITIKKLIHCLKCHNLTRMRSLMNPHEEIQIDLLLEMLEDYGVKAAIIGKNPWTDKPVVQDIEHASHRMSYAIGQWIYDGISLDFSKPFNKNRKSGNREENDAIVATLSDLGFTWNGNVATCDKLMF